MRKIKHVQKRVSFRQKIILVISGLVISFLLLEIGLRIGGFIFLALQEHRNQVSLNKGGTFRIMCLGESTTAIRGGRDTYPEHLEAILNARNLGIKFSVVNKGIPGTTTPYILSQLAENLEKYNPDMVIVMMGINDWFIKYYGDTPHTEAGLLGRSRACRFLKILWLRITNKIKGIEDPAYDTADYAAQARFDEIESSLKKSIEQNPQDYSAYFDLGKFYEGNSRFSQAIEYFKKSIELSLRNSDSYVELGYCYTYQGNFAQAEETFKKAIELNPKDDEAYFGLGEFYERQEDYVKSLEYLKKAIGLNPGDDWSYILSAWCYVYLGKYAQAEEYFKKAIEVNPGNYKTYLELGWFYRDQGKYAEAEKYFKKAIEIDPEDERAYRTTALLYEETGQYDSARRYQRRLSSIRSEYYNSVANLTRNNYLKLKKILDERGVKLVCVQYPMRSIEPLKKIFERQDDVIFVDNEKIFKEALSKTGHEEYFRDMFGGDFGHCTHKGNRLLAENIARVILREYFKIDD